MSLFWTIIFLGFTFSNNYNLSEAKHQKKLPSAVVVGTVYCDTCFQQDFPKPTHFISGASVAVECKETSSRPSFRQETKTDNHGEFKVHLPFSISKHLKKIRNCSVKIISTNEPFCSVAATATSSSINLKSRKEGTHIFSAGFFSFKPLKQPQLCNQKPSTKNFKNPNRAELSPISNPNDPTFPPPLQDPPPSDPPAIGGRNLPPLPQLPDLPPLPQLPPLPGIPILPPANKKEKGVKASEALAKKVNQPMFFLLPPLPLLPPNPLLPPPSILPPLPFQPTPSIIPPVLPTPPPSKLPPVLPNLPPIPGLTPSPPPSAPPTFPVPLPPLPFQPTPGFPRVPPAKDSSQPKTSSP